MDIKCPKCGEPWDMDCLHDEVEARWPEKPWRDGIGENDFQAIDKAYRPYYDQVRKEFYRRGCNALEESYGHADWCNEHQRQAHPGVAAIYELLGDDIDGAASLIDDFGAMGLL